MYFLRFLAFPLQEPQSEDDTAGAYVNSWIQSSSHEAAEARARQLIEESDWRIDALDHACTVSKEDEPPIDATGREYYEQACIDGEVLVFHEWPKSGDD